MGTLSNVCLTSHATCYNAGNPRNAVAPLIKEKGRLQLMEALLSILLKQTRFRETGFMNLGMKILTVKKAIATIYDLVAEGCLIQGEREF